MNPTKSPQTDADWPSQIRAWSVVGILFLAYTFSFIDRQIIVLMVDPIKRDLHLSDTQFGLLHGLAFAIFYTFLGLPLGRLMDIYNRRRIVAIGVALWSVMTAFCGLARTFWVLFACRIGVGVGEAALSPGAYSLIADYFPRHKRGRALSIYSLGISVGVGLAFIFGGIVVDMVSAEGLMTLPLLGEMAPWRTTFIIVGLPGLLIALLVMTIKEPVRREQLVRAGGQDKVTVSDTLAFLSDRRIEFSSLFLGLALLTMASYALMAWFPTMMIRRFSWTPGEIGVAYGLIMVFAGSLGVMAGGILCDYLTSKGSQNAPLQTILLCSVFTLVFAVLAPLMPSPTACLGGLAVATFFILAPFGLAPVAIQAMTPNEMRGQISALYLFSINILGLGLGSTVVGLITDFLFQDEAKVGWSISLAIGIEVPLAILFMLIGMKKLHISNRISAS